jgi:hypothetical protein
MTEQREGVAQPPYPREPNVHSGGKQEPGGLVPPYEGRQESSEGKDLEKERGGPGHEAGPRQVSEAEREGVSDTDTTGASPHGVGVSTSTSGNEKALGLSEEERRSDRLDTGISREGNIDPESPATHSGSQGG